jgi:hypothetical protein
MDQKIKMIKTDASVSITVGSLFIQKFQTLLVSLSQEHTPEELKTLNELIKKGEELPEAWMDNIFTVSALVSALEQEIEKSGQYTEKDISDSDLITKKSES